MRRGYIHKDSRWGRKYGKNVGTAERWISALAAMGLAIFARRQSRHRSTAALASGFLMRRGVTGRCPLYTRLGLSSA